MSSSLSAVVGAVLFGFASATHIVITNDFFDDMIRKLKQIYTNIFPLKYGQVFVPCFLVSPCFVFAVAWLLAISLLFVILITVKLSGKH